MEVFREMSCPEGTFFDSDLEKCLSCPSNCLKCIGEDGEKCVKTVSFSFNELFNDYWALILVITVSTVLILIGCKYLHKCLFKTTIIREGYHPGHNDTHSVDIEMKLHFAENPIANPYTYIVDYVNA